MAAGKGITILCLQQGRGNIDLPNSMSILHFLFFIFHFSFARRTNEE
jgi:hypothetical protein